VMRYILNFSIRSSVLASLAYRERRPMNSSPAMRAHVGVIRV
jgi:hypothetical protein